MTVGSDILECFEEAAELERRESRKVWYAWSGAFCRGGPGRWDTVGDGSQLYEKSARARYDRCSPGKLVFGAPDAGLFWSGECHTLPPYEAWLRLYREECDDALYIWDMENAWTLVIHHEQFGGLVPGPIWSASLDSV